MTWTRKNCVAAPWFVANYAFSTGGVRTVCYDNARCRLVCVEGGESLILLERAGHEKGNQSPGSVQILHLPWALHRWSSDSTGGDLGLCMCRGASFSVYGCRVQ